MPISSCLTGLAGLVAGAFSMAMGEYTSVKTQNEQLDREWVKERKEIEQNPVAEERELAHMFGTLGMTKQNAAAAAETCIAIPSTPLWCT